jgi:hypothetical protein
MKTNLNKKCAHSCSRYEEFCLLGYKAVQSSESQPTNAAPPLKDRPLPSSKRGPHFSITYMCRREKRNLDPKSRRDLKARITVLARANSNLTDRPKVNRLFEGSDRLHLQSRRVSRGRKRHEAGSKQRCSSERRLTFNGLRGVIPEGRNLLHFEGI